MASRPATRESQKSHPVSIESFGIGTVETNHLPSVVAEEVADDITYSMFDSVLGAEIKDIDETGVPAEALTQLKLLKEQNAAFKVKVETLEAELASARSEKEEVLSRHRVAETATDDLKKQNDLLKDNEFATKVLESELATVNRQLTARNGELEQSLAEAKSECERLLKQLESSDQSGAQQNLEAERNALQEHASRLENQVTQLNVRLAEAQAIIAEQSEEAMRKDTSAQPTIELPGDSGDEKPLLAAAYQQISVLNTQLAHLYTELTMARTEVQRLRSEQSLRTPNKALQGDSEAEVLKQSQQIADLVSDIRHLQLDLEYHQQKLDQMIEEKQAMMRDMKKCQAELEDAKRQIEERDQMLKHREVDLRKLREDELKSRSSQMGEGEGSSDGTLVALRAEAAAKDSALIVSHYELHKEKLLRDRLEQKNLKLMERMQKLMMVVETMRKENVTLERNLFVREQSCETKEQQLRQVTQKARQLQKAVKAGKMQSKGGGKTVFEMESKEGLPRLDQSQRSIDSGGRRSGASTPRTPRAPASPYGIK